MEPLCIDLFCGLGGWAEGFLAEGYRVVGFDIERHDYGRGGYPSQLVLQDALTLHGSQFRDAACIVASPPCQEYSYMAMPWKLAKAKAAAIRADESGEAMRRLTALFDACFRIQREAIEATAICSVTGDQWKMCDCGYCERGPCTKKTRYIPLIVENVKGAQPWVGPAKAHFGSFYLWGDVAMVGNRVVSSVPVFGRWTRPMKSGWKFNPDGTEHPQGSWFKIADSKERGANTALKVEGFNFHEHEKTGKPGRSFQSAAVDGLKNPGMTSWSDHGKPGYRPQGFNVTNAQPYRESNGVKCPGNDTFKKSGKPCGKLTDARYPSDGVKQGGNWWHDPESMTRRFSSKSNSRKAASAEIAKIPFELASYIARSYNTSTVN